MKRTLIGTAAGVVAGLLALAGWGAYFGYVNGMQTAGVPPGLHAAARQAFSFVVYFSWAALPLGGGIGALAGFGSWLARPVRRPEREVPID